MLYVISIFDLVIRVFVRYFGELYSLFLIIVFFLNKDIIEMWIRELMLNKFLLKLINLKFVKLSFIYKG